MNAIEIIDLHKTFKAKGRAFQALRGVNLTVKQGEAFGFIGPNGAGKSTTIKIMLDVIRSDRGQVKLYENDSRRPVARQRVSYLPENPYLYDSLTPLEIVSIGLRQHGFTGHDVRNKAMHWLEKFDVAYAANKKIRQLSKGMTQRTALAHCLAPDPRMVILDEPLSGLDPVGRRDVVNVLREYHMSGGTLFFTSHVLHDVETVADRFGLIVDGSIKVTKTSMEVLEESSVYTLEVLCNKALTGFTQFGPGHYFREITHNEIWDLIPLLKQDGAKITALKPRLNLEALFFDQLSAR